MPPINTEEVAAVGRFVVTEGPEVLAAAERLVAQTFERSAPRAAVTGAAELPAFSLESPGLAARELATRLEHMAPKAPMRDLIHSVLETGHQPTIEALGDYFKLPMSARTLMNGTDIEKMTALVRGGSEHGLSQVRADLGAAKDLAAGMPHDATTAEILSRVKQTGLPGYNPWLGGNVSLKRIGG